jgi:uncharacterized protein YbjT (DUF2867 family)
VLRKNKCHVVIIIGPNPFLLPCYSCLNCNIMTVLALFGATGNIGADLLEALATSTADVKDLKCLVFTRDPAAARNNITLHVSKNDVFEFVHFDPTRLTEAMQKARVDTCFICVPQNMVYVAKEYVKPIVDACVASKVVKRVVKVGTFDPTKYEYGKKHLSAEDYIRNQNLKLTVVQGGALSSDPDFLGPGPPGAPYMLIDIFSTLSHLSIIGLALFRTMGSCASFTGEAKHPFCDTRDMADALAAILLTDKPKEHEGKTYFIVSEPRIGPRETAATYGAQLGRTIPVKFCDEPEQRLLLGMSGDNPEMIELLIEMFARISENQSDYDSDDFKLLTGKTPRTFAAFVEERVKSSLRPPPLWLLRTVVVSLVVALAAYVFA